MPYKTLYNHLRDYHKIRTSACKAIVSRYETLSVSQTDVGSATGRLAAPVVVLIHEVGVLDLGVLQLLNFLRTLVPSIALDFR